MPETSGSKLSVADLRREYTRIGLTEEELNADPIEQFSQWFSEVIAAESLDPNAMTLATASADGRPSARTVLLKGFDERGFVFFTNYESSKARDLAENPWAALTFYWGELARQVRITGRVSKVTREESETYFHSRPTGSQISAAISPQSQVISGREVLEDRVREMSEQYGDGDIPLPPVWGGYRVEPDMIEFWQGRPNRLHDRLRYRKEAGVWRTERLAP